MSETGSIALPRENSGGCDLVLEGGGMRGVFTSGVLDVFLEHGLRGFKTVWGVSAGAINACSFLSGQIGRCIRDNLAFRDDRRFMSLYSLAKTGNIAGAEFIYSELQDDIDPFDYEAFASNPTRFKAVASDVVFGTPAYLDVTSLPEDIDKVRASASLPLVSKVVEIGDSRYLDGGTCDSVPVERAIEEGARRLVVVLTRDRDYVKEPSSHDLLSLAERRYAKYPYYLEALRKRPERYNEQRRHIWELEERGVATVIAPSEPVMVGSTGHPDGESLLRLYLDGRRQAEKALSDVRASL